MKLQDVTVSYPSFALKAVSFSMKNAERVAIVGKSGSGKTTLLRAIAGLLAYEGRMEDVPSLSFVFQTDRLVAPLSVEENIRLVAPQADLDKWLIPFGLEGKQNEPISSLSGGEKRRVAFARALAFDSQILLADEPFTGLDLSTKSKIFAALSALSEERGLLLVSHDLDAAYALCERVIVLDEGRVVMDERIADLPRKTLEEWFAAR